MLDNILALNTRPEKFTTSINVSGTVYIPRWLGARLFTAKWEGLTTAKMVIVPIAEGKENNHSFLKGFKNLDEYYRRLPHKLEFVRRADGNYECTYDFTTE